MQAHTWITTNIMVQWLRLQIKMEWFPHPFQTYPRTLRSFTCCGRAAGSIIAPLPPHLLAPILGVDINFGSSHLGYNQHHGAVAEAPDPHGMVPTSFISKYQRRLRSFTCFRKAAGSIITPLPSNLLSQISGVDEDIGSHLGYNQHDGSVVEAPDPHGIVPTSF